jgi:hypothetical protein
VFILFEPGYPTLVLYLVDGGPAFVAIDLSFSAK